MRHGSNGGRRGRGGSNRNNGGGSRRSGGNKGRTQVFDSNGPDVRIRGTAHQINEKYLNLAKDANSSGDHVMAQSQEAKSDDLALPASILGGSVDVKSEEKQPENA